MENKSLLRTDKVYVTDKLYVRIPTVGEILDEEQKYFNIVNTLTAVPYQYMVQLDDVGIDFTTMSEYDLFLTLFMSYKNSDISLVFGDLDISDFKISECNNCKILFSLKNDISIDEDIYNQLVSNIRNINNLEKIKYKIGNEEAKKYLLKKERKRQKKLSNKPYKKYLEKIVIALVNNKDFKYDYDSVMNLSYFRFNQSFNQIQTNINFDKTMLGIYSGTVDTTKLKDKSCLSWIQTK